MNSISKTTSMGTIAGAALAAAGLGQSGTATAARVAPASTPMVTLWIGVNDDGNGHFVVGDYVVYASDSGDNGGLASYDINLGGVSTISNYSPHGYYDDGTGCGTDNELGFTYGRTFNNVSPVSASQDTLPYGQSYPVIFVYGFGQTAGNLGNDAAPGSTGPDGSATQAVYGAPLLLVKGTYFYNPNHPAPPTLTNWGSDSVTVFQTNSGNATEAATLDFTRVTVVPGGSHSALLSVMTSGTSSPAYIGTRNPGTAGNSSAITLAKNGTDYVPGLLNNISGNATAGALTINGYDGNGPELIGVAIMVSDGGNSTPHAPSAQEIADIITDLNASPLLVSGVTATVEAFNGSTAGTLQHDNLAAYTLLSSANAADGGQTLELAVLISGLNPANPQTFGLDFGNESVDGITAVDVTDLAMTEVPEPVGTSLLLLGGLPLMLRRRRK